MTHGMHWSFILLMTMNTAMKFKWLVIECTIYNAYLFINIEK
jgi:hypothetical protein